VSYAIAELKDTETGGFAPRGAVKTLWQSRDFETIVSGPAETGKTWGSLQYADALLWKYPRAHGVMLRKTYADLVASCLRTYLRILGPDTPVKAYGGERPQWFDYPNGSRLWVAGLDNAGKVLSTERDFFYVNQAEETTLEDWETMTTRATGRGAVMPYTRVFGDCNPGPPQHWIRQRQSSGRLRLIESRHEDNPTLYDDTGHITAQGVRSISVLDALTGARKQRLRYGKWAQSEGAVYEDYDEAVHLIDPRDFPADWRRIRCVDFGYTNPFVCQWWAIDPDGRMYLYREIYKTRTLVEDHAKEILRLSGDEKYEATISDHDAEDRATLHRHGIYTVPAAKAITPGIEVVSARLKKAGDRPRLFLVRNAVVERDERLADSKLPQCTTEEIGDYSYPKGVDGKPVKEDPIKVNDHGMDAMRYAVAYIDGLGETVDPSVLDNGAGVSVTLV
jgi:PBSX family phage terminase large subunit